MSSLPSWNENLSFEGVNYIMDSSNGWLYDPYTHVKVGQWEPNYQYSYPDNCEGIVTWINDERKRNHEVKVSLQKEGHGTTK